VEIFKNDFWPSLSRRVVFISLALFPNFLGMINIDTSFGFRVHFFQLAIFIVAMIYGAKGGFFAGVVGSIYSAVIMHNYYILLFNAILGVTFGYFFSKGFPVLSSILLAFAIELPVLIVIDYYFVGIPFQILIILSISLLISNCIWGTILSFFKQAIENVKPHL